ncbi:hypothetical protein BpOF4_04490 [Alkalihalophilus pseudofirmus OF4]|uniref:Uncharacterized protein n=1 Tax=Alkalihalophilus pseudofirmus (strain ATCC BAA-2126 / JCM 17055 / OF4) TaxID=398511 RepID=D3FYS9_ALKPO|nr:hypothetical protein [Alkalihalophilus pseudofirmus]ADC48962.1 hypothetical protein BpOF4_04490 [Alkalihalophilus pseudofirmus OF4]
MIRNEKKLEAKAKEVFKMVGSKYAAPEAVLRISTQIIALGLPEMDAVSAKQRQSNAKKGVVFEGVRGEIEGFTNAILKADENKRRSQVLNKTREEWEALEFEYTGYIPKVNAYGETICACWRCSEASANNSKYCGEKCSNEQKRALRQFKKYGTYLPTEAFQEVREENKEKRERRNTLTMQEYERAIDKQINEIGVKKKAPTSDSLEGHKIKVLGLDYSNSQARLLSGKVNEFKMSTPMLKWYLAMAYGTKQEVESVENMLMELNHVYSEEENIHLPAVV